MGVSTLSWTKYAPLEDDTSFIDPIALDYFAQVLGNLVLPSFTTRTSRARYYSMVCYGIYICQKFLELQGKPYYEKDILEVFKLYEKFWARCVVEYYGQNRGGISERDGKELDLRGKRGAIKSFNNNVMSLGDEYKFLTRQLELGGLGAYRTSMESLELIGPYLNLTHKGIRLADAFRLYNYNDKLLLKVIDSHKVIQKEGRASLNSVGYHTCLDGFYMEGYPHEDERALLREYILNNFKNITSINLIYNNYDYSGKNIMTTIQRIVDSQSFTDEGERVIEGFKTILAFEILAIALNKLWCKIIKAAENNIGRISIFKCSEECKSLIDHIFTNNLIEELLSKSNYPDIIDSYHGTSFNIFLSHFNNNEKLDYQLFIIELIKYHKEIMTRRNSGAWIIMDNEDILVLAGYDYPKRTENLEYLHSYKINNIMSLIEDTGWSPDA